MRLVKNYAKVNENYGHRKKNFEDVESDLKRDVMSEL